MSSYKPTQALPLSAAERALTDDNLYWKRFETVSVSKEVSDVKQLAFRPGTAEHLAAVASTRVTIYNSCTSEPIRLLSRFKHAVHSVAFRPDGQLMAVGDDIGLLRLFDTTISGRSSLRSYNAHKGAIHRCAFAGGSSASRPVFTFGDDRLVKCWDTTESSAVPIVTLSNGANASMAHLDFVRAGVAAHQNSNIVVSGGYDKQICVWDTRTPSKACASVDHGAPVEDLLMFPNDQLLVSVGGTYLKVWDLSKLSGVSEPLVQVSSHHKTITSAAFGSDHTRILTAGLDKHVKVYNVLDYSVVHTFDYPAPILSLAVSDDDLFVAAGMTGGGLLSIVRQKPQSTDVTATNERQKKSRKQYKRPHTWEGDVVQTIVEEKTINLAPWDRFMKTFRHHDALTRVISCQQVLRQKPELVVSVLDQLIRRRSLSVALAGRQIDTLAPLIKFIGRHITSEHMSRTLVITSNTLIDVYFPNNRPSATVVDPKVAALFDKLFEQLADAIKLSHECAKLLGAADMLTNCAQPPRSSSSKTRNEPIHTTTIF